MGFTECILIENNWEEPFQIRWSQRNIYAVTGRLRRIQSLEEPRTDGLLPSSVFQGWLWAETLKLRSEDEGLCILSYTNCLLYFQIEEWRPGYFSPHIRPVPLCTVPLHAYTNTHITFFLNYLKVTDIYFYTLALQISACISYEKGHLLT